MISDDSYRLGRKVECVIYLDHAATTPVHEEVLQTMYEFEKQHFGNPSSIHQFGRTSKYYLSKARRYLAETIHAEDNEIIFTSGGTEANNLAVIGTALENEYNGNHIITSTQEHHAVINIMDFLQKKGFHVTYLPVNRDGQISVDDLKRSLTDNTILVSIMMANNETGAIQPIKEVGELLQDHQAYFHTDAVQAYSMLDIDVNELHVDLLTSSAHKISGPKGIGFLYKRNEVPMQQLLFGGNQELTKRPGTENVVGTIGYHQAAKLANENKQVNYEKYKEYKTLFIDTLTTEEIDFEVNGNIEKAVPTILNISFPGATTEVLLTNLDLEGVAASGGSACTSGALEASHVLKAMYSFRDDRINNSVRFSFGRANSKEDIVQAAKKVAMIVKRVVPLKES